ncbi:hypothetical protein [Sphingomonas crocodyli]|uniref:2,4-diaminopentanoate dehydrogenase C-terminal domain-containing protein n=1 Tax=Sphingomonas crocodyli TaxID=1979270 RepID=A0A437M8S0_9SPHN|nr:hypothetical protein [Sphingomonas crocodyli]RVT94049.1 hypothetical protein EOD43_09385 [Sphingomonas crocodyli]
MDRRPLRIIQCGAGLAGKEGLRAIIERDDLELVGLYAHSDANVGRDAGDFAGFPDTGIRATNDMAALLATDADAVVYMVRQPNLDVICGFLSRGVDVLTSAGFMFPAWNDKEAARRLEKAGKAGGASFFVSGQNPGFVDEVLVLTLSSLSGTWDVIRIDEYADCSRYPNQGTLAMMGFGHTPEDFASGKVAELATMVGFFEASIAGLAHGLGMDLDEIRSTRELVTTPRALELQVGRIEAGTVAGQRWRWVGIKDGVERIVQNTYWVVGFDLAEGWPKSGEMDGDTRWEVTIEGRPSLRCVFDARESFVPGAMPTGAYNASGAATALALVNRLHAVAAARPGIVAAGDLAQPRWKG